MSSETGERASTSKAPIYPDLAAKVAVVTGGSGGIGAATCRLLASNGVKVVVNGRDEAKIGAVVDAIRSTGGEALGVAADCTDLAAVERMRKHSDEELGSVGVVAAFAGGGRARPGPLAQITEEEWHSTVDANLTATFLTLKSFLPGMIERGGGSFVTMASSAARFPTGADPLRGSQGGGDHAHLPGRTRSRQVWRPRQLPGSAHGACRAHAAVHARRTAAAACGRDPTETAGYPRGRGAGHALSRFRELLLDHGCNARCGGGHGHLGSRRHLNKGGNVTQLIGKQELPNNGSVYTFEGYLYSDVDVSFFLSDTAPGKGPDLHKHPYDEVFVVQEGELTFTVGEETIKATGGQIVIAPAGARHKFVNSGAGRARHIDIHASRRMITEWLEDRKIE
jgi:NAD(P)-dependent dehydrogenase (short-subunit alcohol dehydrogenase family)/quercetin dioxygenase-like cupin family protein